MLPFTTLYCRPLDTKSHGEIKAAWHHIYLLTSPLQTFCPVLLVVATLMKTDARVVIATVAQLGNASLLIFLDIFGTWYLHCWVIQWWCCTIIVPSFETLSSSKTPEGLEVKDSSDPLDRKHPISWTFFDLLLNFWLFPNPGSSKLLFLQSLVTSPKEVMLCLQSNQGRDAHKIWMMILRLISTSLKFGANFR